MYGVMNRRISSYQLSEHKTREEAEAECARLNASGGEYIVVELAYCNSCGEAGGLIPVAWLDGWGCERPGCMY